MDSVETERRIARVMAVTFSLAAAGALLWAAWFAMTDWRAAAEFRLPEARAYASLACRAISGCETMTIRAGYDWRRGERHVVVRIELGLDGSFAEASALDTLGGLAKQVQDRWLRWALSAKPVIETAYPRPPSAARRRITGDSR